MNKIGVLFLAFALGAVPLRSSAEETYPIINWIKDGRIAEDHDNNQIKHPRTLWTGDQETSIPALVEAINVLNGQTTRRYFVCVPKTPEEAMNMLDGIDENLEKLTFAVGQFNRSKKTLTLSINRLAQQTERKRRQTSGWEPVLMGNLRILSSKSLNARDDLWLIVAVIILEKQVRSIEKRRQHSNSNDTLMAKLHEQENDLEHRRRELLGALGDIREQLKGIRRKASESDQS